jgi:hypothetical protein
MTPMSLRADCARCAALCCVALAFDKSDLFGFDKPAGEPCAHLSPCGGCGIHASRRDHGFGGCIGYDCLGAGQRVTQDLFGGRTWLQDPALLDPMARAFLALQKAHRLLLLLRQASQLPLAPADQTRRAELEAAAGGSDITLDSVAGLEIEVQSFLRGLRGYLDDERARSLPVTPARSSSRA